MNMSFGYGVAEESVSVQLLNEALDYGYTFLDTAMVYGSGHNEELIGKSLSARRQEYVLATKCGLSRDGINGDPELISKSCDASLARLKTDCIDLYYLHRVDPHIPIEDSVGALAHLVQQGKVREIGLSEVCSDNLRRAHAVHPIAALQSEYSLWSRTPERGILDVCDELGVAFVPFSPLGRAFLTGKSSSVAELPEDDLRCTIARPRFEPAAFEKNIRLLKPFGELAKKQGCSMAQLAIAWLLAQRNRNLIPIPGTKHIEFMKENGAAAEIELDKETLAALDCIINENTVTGDRYTADRMASSDSERD
jgi:aryl-alcohol dehydrogenase-like predicted oxidoreductase